MSERRTILDMGCGRCKHAFCGAEVIGIDVDPNSKADIIHDLNMIPYPFEDCRFDEIICQDVLEHLDDLNAVMSEIWRIAKPGGIVRIRTPHYSSYYAYNDPTHRHHFGYYAFDVFNDKGFQILSKRIDFPRIWRITGLSRLFNRNPKRWEQLLCFLFRAENLRIEMMVRK